ncbi:uncharacterized protein LOC135399901 [Ornithodoros turicata]|uniref:uncharacterized protein LOC135399901 n=1 Tax=Ornithodoros turicata TaxID=34597 RepID=UPI00313948B5
MACDGVGIIFPNLTGDRAAWTTHPLRQNLLRALLIHRLRRKRKRTMYIRDIFDKRTVLGEYHHLVQELRNDDPEYHFKYFRMTKASFDHLLGVVRDRILHAPTHRRPILPAERLAVALRFLSTGGSMQDIAMSYRMHRSTVSMILKETLPAIWDCLSPVVLKVPTRAAWEDIRNGFDTKWNFPNAIGSIDGKHFAIRCPDKSGSDYYNYKGFHSVVLLAVADADYRFILVDIGAQGRLSDGSVFRDSAIGKSFEQSTLDLPANMSRWPLCLVGDAAFPLRPYLMRPYPGRNLTEKKKVFNYRLSRARRCVENAFGILASRWRSFLGTVEGDPDLLTSMIKAAVCLHNFLMSDSVYCPSDYGDTVCGEALQEGSWRQVIRETVSHNRSTCNRSAPAAMALRDDIATYFMSTEGSLPWQLKVVRRS